MAPKPIDNPHHQSKIITVYVFFQLLGLAVLVLTSIWLTKYLDGFAWNGTSKLLNVHVLCMVIGMVFLFGNAIVLYAVYTDEEKLHVKIAHSSFHGLALICIVVGLAATCEFHRAEKLPNMYSIHSWFGVITVSLYALQFIIAMFSYCFPKARDTLWACYYPVHHFAGEIIFVLVGITVISGILDRLVLEYGYPKYEDLPAGAAFGNAIGLIIVAFIITALLIIALGFMRPKKGEECNEGETMQLVSSKPE